MNTLRIIILGALLLGPAPGPSATWTGGASAQSASYSQPEGSGAVTTAANQPEGNGSVTSA